MFLIENLSKSFGQIEALNNFSVRIYRGKINIFAGADGAGKSSLFKILLGLLKRDFGKIIFKNKEVENNFNLITSVSGYMPEKFSLYQDLTVEENLNFFADIRGVSKTRREELKKTLLDKTGMSAFKNRRAGALSGGMKQKLSLSTILLSGPELIILDEPTTGVDPLSRIEFFDIIESLKDEGKTIIISTPYLDEAEKGDNIIFMKDGKVIKQDAINNLQKDVPFKIFSLTPKDNIFETVMNLKRSKEHRDRIYIKGEYIKYIGSLSTTISDLDFIKNKEIKIEKPNLEDIYIYYERLYEKES